MSDDQQQTAAQPQQTNGGDRQAAPEELAIRSQHKQALAKIEADTETELARLDAERTRRMPIALRMFFDDRLYERAAMIAERMASAQGFTPQHLIGEPGACFAVVSKALAWNLDPFSVAQSTYQVGGRVAYEGRLVQAVMEASGRLKGGIHASYIGDWSKVDGKFRMEGNKPVRAWKDEDEDGLGIVLRAQIHGEDEPREFTFYLRQCFPRNASTWPTRPRQQLHYNAIRAFASVAAPSLLLGVPFQEDIEAGEPPMRDITPPQAPPPVDLAAEGIRGGGETGTTPQTANAAHPAADAQQASKGGGRRTNTEIQKYIIAGLQNASSTGEVQTILDANRQYKLNEKIWAEIELEADAARDRIAGQGQGDAFATLQGQAMATAEDAGRTLIKLVIACQAEGELDPFEDPESEVGAVVAKLPDEWRDRVARNVSGRRQQIIDMAEEQPSERGMARPAGEDADPPKNLFPGAA